jgi:hypothetical protein
VTTTDWHLPDAALQRYALGSRGFANQDSRHTSVRPGALTQKGLPLYRDLQPRKGRRGLHRCVMCLALGDHDEDCASQSPYLDDPEEVPGEEQAPEAQRTRSCELEIERGVPAMRIPSRFGAAIDRPAAAPRLRAPSSRLPSTPASLDSSKNAFQKSQRVGSGSCKLTIAFGGTPISLAASLRLCRRH